MARKLPKKKPLVLRNPPIVEAVLDIDCLSSAPVDLAAIKEQAQGVFRPHYPKSQARILRQHQFEQHGAGPPTHAASQGLQALQFLTDDGKQVVQVRADGFSFNRLAPYTTLDDYFPAIESGWNQYRDLVSPFQVRLMRLRYINRINLPIVNGELILNRYLDVGPQLRDPEGLLFQSLLNQYVAVEASTGNELRIVLSTEAEEGEVQPVILDITASKAVAIEVDDWNSIRTTITDLRRLKNHVFESTLTQRCLKLFH